MRQFIAILIILSWIFADFFLFAKRITGAEIAVSMSPQLKQIIAKPGSTIKIPYRIANYGTDIYIATKLYSVTSTDKTILLPYQMEADKPQIKYGDSSDVKLFLSQEVIEDYIEITIPANAPEKEYRYVLVAANEPQQHFGTNSSIGLRVGASMNILLFVTETAVDTGSLTSSDITISNMKTVVIFQKMLHIVDSTFAKNFSVTMQNAGNYTRFIQPQISLSDKTHVRHLIQNPASWLLEPHKKKDITAPLLLSYWPKKYHLMFSITEKSKQQIAKEITFFTFPYIGFFYLSGTVIFITGLTWLISLRSKSYRSKWK